MAVEPTRSDLPKRRRGNTWRLVAGVDPVAMAGIALAISLSIALDVTGAASGVESLLAGLMGTTISLLIDSMARAERRFHLRSLVEGEPWIATALGPIIEGTREAIEKYPDTPVAVEARDCYERLKETTEQLRAGRVVRPGGEPQDLLTAARAAKSRIDAVTNVMPHARGELSWWHSGTGRRYWEANIEAISRGVKITRVFVYASMTDDLRELVTDQHQHGVQVRLLKSDAASSGHHRNLVICDRGIERECAWEGRTLPNGEIGENFFTVNRNDVRKLWKDYESCLRDACFHDGEWAGHDTAHGVR